MAKTPDGPIATPSVRPQTDPIKGWQVVTLKDLRKASKQTQKDLAAALGVGQDAISRLENRDDMLLSTLEHYVESIGGKLECVATFENRPPVIIDRIAHEKPPPEKDSAAQGAIRND